MGTQPLLEKECEFLLIIESRGGGGDLLYLTIVFCIQCIDDGLFFIIMI